jgi:hypothetical protein
MIALTHPLRLRNNLGWSTVRPRRLGRLLPNNYLRPLFQMGSLKLEFLNV